MRAMTLPLIFGLAVPCAGWAQIPGQEEKVPPKPLFASEDPLTLTLRAPFHELFGDRDDDAPEQPASLTYFMSGDSVTLPLQVELRGHNRRRSAVCNFPPIRLDFPRSEMDGTLFEGQNRVKLVTHCQNGRSEYEQYVLMEMLIYRMYNLITDLSFRVRLAHLTYIDTEGRNDTLTRVGFLIEDDDDMAERNGWKVLEIPMVSPADIDQLQLNKDELFQFMIGHTDWSAFAAQSGEDTCCHNGRLIGTMVGPVYPVPYDFDFAGLINARYAEVSEGLRLRNVQQRLYRGVCHDEGVLEQTIGLFVEHQDDFYNLFRTEPGLEDRYREQAIDYLEEFFEIAQNEGRVRRDLLGACRRME